MLNGTKAVVAMCRHPPSKRRDCPNIRRTGCHCVGGSLAMSTRDIARTRLRTPAPRGTPPLTLSCLRSDRCLRPRWVIAAGICESPERPDLDITDPVLFLDYTRTSPAKPIEYCQSRKVGCKDAATSSPTVKCRCINSWRFGAATLFGREDRSLNPSRRIGPEDASEL